MSAPTYSAMTYAPGSDCNIQVRAIRVKPKKVQVHFVDTTGAVLFLTAAQAEKLGYDLTEAAKELGDG